MDNRRSPAEGLYGKSRGVRYAFPRTTIWKMARQGGEMTALYTQREVSSFTGIPVRTLDKWALGCLPPLYTKTDGTDEPAYDRHCIIWAVALRELSALRVGKGQEIYVNRGLSVGLPSYWTLSNGENTLHLLRHTPCHWRYRVLVVGTGDDRDVFLKRPLDHPRASEINVSTTTTIDLSIIKDQLIQKGME